MKNRKFIRYLFIAICIYLAFTTVQGTIGLLSSGEKVTRREKELAKLKQEKNELLRKEKKVSSEEFLEKAAYDELGLSKQGEKVYIIPSDLLEDKTPEIIVVNKPNWQLWRDLLF